MIPLRHLSIDLSTAPAPPQRGTVMTPDRAVVLLLLAPDAFYTPMDIARIAFTWELQQATPDPLLANYLKRFRNAYCQIALRISDSSNPCLSGREWSSLVGPALHGVAELMNRLAAAQAAQPGVIFTVAGEELLPYPDQSASTAPPLPPDRQQLVGRYSFPISEAPSATGEDQPAEDPAVLVEVPAEPSPVPQVVAAEPEPEPTRVDDPPPARAKAARSRWSRRLTLAASVLGVTMVPAALFGYFWASLDEVYLEDIVELGAPFSGQPHFLTLTKRFEQGDWVRFEGQVGIIKKISRESIIVGEREYPAPTLYFFGERMMTCGNYVVYPASPRPIAGNFFLDHIDYLDELEPGHLGWEKGFETSTFAVTKTSAAGAFLSQVSGVDVVFVVDKSVSVPEGVQLRDIFVDCERQGGLIEERMGQVVIKWD